LISTGTLEWDYADAVHMEDGSVGSCEKSEFNYVWLARMRTIEGLQGKANLIAPWSVEFRG